MTTRKLVRPKIRVVAFDISMGSLRTLRNILKDNSVIFVRGDLNTLPFCKGLFDKVLCADVVNQLPDENLRRNCVRELARVARPKSRAVLKVRNLSISKKRAGWSKESRSARTNVGPVQYVYRFEVKEFYSLLASSMIVDRIVGAGFNLPYRFKIGLLSSQLEKLFRHLNASAQWGNMLVGVCHRV